MMAYSAQKRLAPCSSVFDGRKKSMKSCIMWLIFSMLFVVAEKTAAEPVTTAALLGDWREDCSKTDEDAWHIEKEDSGLYFYVNEFSCLLTSPVVVQNALVFSAKCSVEEDAIVKYD